MLTSQDRILTTHTGSLPRIEGLADVIIARQTGERIAQSDFDAAVERATLAVIEKQLAAGIDVGNDGEMPRPDFTSYIAERMTGFGMGGEVKRPIPQDAQKFPVWFSLINSGGRRRLNVYNWPRAVADIAYGDGAGVEAECAAFHAAHAKASGQFGEAFMTSVAPGFAACALANNHYDSHESYVFALARALKDEYRRIVDAGFILQIDAPDFGMERQGFFQNDSLPAFIQAIEMHMAALNEALEGIPREKVRLHSCWGNRDGPHYFDVPCPDVLPVLYQAKAGALVLPFANARHSHEIEAFRTQPLPDDMVLVVGAVETTNNYVEHPMVVAERLERAAKAVGDPTRIMAGTDCGFGTVAGDTFTAEDVAWAKLEALCEGARIASGRVF